MGCTSVKTEDGNATLICEGDSCSFGETPDNYTGYQNDNQFATRR